MFKRIKQMFCDHTYDRKSGYDMDKVHGYRIKCIWCDHEASIVGATIRRLATNNGEDNV